jgi:hypothetical protein
VEILGIEGQGLSLVEELLKPGARQNVVEATNSSDSKVSLGDLPRQRDAPDIVM